VKRFQFRLESVLELRRQQRDRCRLAHAAAVRREHELQAWRARILAERVAQLDELRAISRQGAFDIDAAAARRYYVTRLQVELRELDQRGAELARTAQQTLRALIEADRAVNVLEKLKERQRARFEADELKRETIETEETWLVARRATLS